MRLVALAAALSLSLPLCAQETEKAPKPAAKKPVGPQKAHHKASKDEIRKFNELQKKQQKAK